MPDTFTETLRAVALNIGVPALIVFWYTCRVRHPARPRWQAFLMALAVLATVPAALCQRRRLGWAISRPIPRQS